MAIEQVKEYFRAFGMEERIQELSESSATVGAGGPGAALRPRNALRKRCRSC